MPKKKKQESKITAIVCVDTNYGIGYQNQLLIQIPDDMQHFSRTTSGGIVIMGRKTFESLPDGPLAKRINLIVTSTSTYDIDFDSLKPRTPVYISIQQVKDKLLEIREKKDDCKIAIIGGAQIYKELLPYCDYISITKVFKRFENVDSYFPNIDFSQEWDLVSASDVMDFEGIKYQYRKYKNLKPIKKEKPKKATTTKTTKSKSKQSKKKTEKIAAAE